MTREEAERVAARLVTVERSPEDDLYAIVRVAGVAVSSHLGEHAERWAEPWREAIVRMLTEES